MYDVCSNQSTPNKPVNNQKRSYCYVRIALIYIIPKSLHNNS
jgi:hypothetical protein